MRIRVLAGLLCLMLLIINCSKSTTKISPNTTLPVSEPHISTPVSEEIVEQTDIFQENLPEIIRILMSKDRLAQQYILDEKLYEAQQEYEDARDIITIFEEDESADIPTGYFDIKDQIEENYITVLELRNIDLHENDLGILLKNITISDTVVDETPETEKATDGISVFPMAMNSKVEQAIAYFEKDRRGRRTLEVWLQRAGKYLPMIFEAIEQEGLPRELAYLAMIESGLRPTVRSRARAVGMWQFIAATGKNNGLKIDYYVDERRDPFKATHAAMRHLKDLYYHWGNDWYLALAGYNCSERRIRRDMKKYNTRDYWKLRTLPRQTRNYVPTFIAVATIASDPEKYGFENPFMQAWVFDEAVVNRQASLDVIANAAGVSESSLLDLNTELQQYHTPDKPYTMRFPKGTGSMFKANFSKIPDNKLITKVFVRIQRGQTLDYLARKYKCSVTQIMRVNGIKNPRTLQIGQRLEIPIQTATFKKHLNADASSYRNSGPVIPWNADQLDRVVYTVKIKDTLSEIAELHRIGLSKLLSWNGKSRRSTIHPGQKLVLWLPKASSAVANSVKITKIDGKNEVIHTVRRGDSISRISNLYGVKAKDVLAWNGLRSSAVIHPGDKIRLYFETETIDLGKAVESSYLTYIVRQGDKLWNIAKKFGTSVNIIMRLNNKRNSLIYPGDILLIPAQ